MGNKAEGDSLDDGAGGESKDETQGTQLNALVFIAGNQSSQRRVCDVIGGVETGIQHHVEDEEECILCNLAPGGGNGKDCKQADAAAQIRPKHPGACLTHLGVGFVNEGAKDYVGDAVEDLRNSHQGADDTGVQADGIAQVDHDEEGQECVDHIAGNVTGAVADLVVPLQVSLLIHGIFPLCLA